MAYPLPQQGEHFTYRDLLTWPEGERWELIDGVAYDMTPAPSTSHQGISRELLTQFALFLRGKPCKVFAAPFNVLLPKGNEADEDVDTIVEPDIVVICDRNKITEHGCTGAPDLVIEIISPSTSRKDLRIKFATYQRVGVREYWIVLPVDHAVMVYTLDKDGQYGQPASFGMEDNIAVGVLEGLTIDLVQVFTGT